MPRILLPSLLLAVAFALAACGDDPERTVTVAPASAPDILAQDRAATRVARTGQVALEVFYTDRQTYAADRAGLEAIEPALAEGIGARLRVSETGRETYALAVESDSGTTFTVARGAGGAVRRGCSEPGAGGCGADGAW